MLDLRRLSCFLSVIFQIFHPKMFIVYCLRLLVVHCLYKKLKTKGLHFIFKSVTNSRRSMNVNFYLQLTGDNGIIDLRLHKVKVIVCRPEISLINFFQSHHSIS